MSFTVEMACDALRKMNAIVNEKCEYLTDLDSAIGDADHGTNMSRGMASAIEKIDGKRYEDFSSLFRDVAMTIMSAVGGSAGPLYGMFFMKLGLILKDKSEASVDDMAQAMDEGVRGIMELGKSQPGDKTMIDALYPAVEALRENAGNGQAVAWEAAARAAETGMKSTIPMLSHRGRSSYLGERSIGHQDPGATSSYYMIDSFRAAAVGGI